MDSILKYGIGSAILGGLAGITLGLGIGNYLGYRMGQPTRAMFANVNNDQYKDLLVMDNAGKSHILLGQVDGEFLELEKHWEAQRDNITTRNKQEIKVRSTRPSLEAEASK